MENSTLTKPSQPRCAEPPSTRESLIEEWLPKLAVNAGAALDAKTQAVYRAIWLEGLGDLSLEVLRAAFQKTLRECVFWPVKVADIRKHIARVETGATNLAAEKAWQRVLEIRRLHWNPDIRREPEAPPTSFERATAALSERVQQAARAANIFREFTAEEFEGGALHTWAKKRFIESFIAWGEVEQDKFLLPDGEIKNLLAGVAKLKALPSPPQNWNELHARGLEYAKTPNVRAGGAGIANTAPIRETPSVVDVEGRAVEIERQKRLILQKHPNLGNMKGIPPELRPAEMEARP